MNPRYPSGYTRLPIVHLRPLGHLSKRKFLISCVFYFPFNNVVTYISPINIIVKCYDYPNIKLIYNIYDPIPLPPLSLFLLPSARRYLVYPASILFCNAKLKRFQCHPQGGLGFGVLSQPPVTFPLAGNLLGGSPCHIHSNNTLDVSRAVSWRPSNPPISGYQLDYLK